jgi:hypothetical protein
MGGYSWTAHKLELYIWLDTVGELMEWMITNMSKDAITTQLGCKIYEEFMTVVILTKQLEMRGTDLVWREFLQYWRVRGVHRDNSLRSGCRKGTIDVCVLGNAKKNGMMKLSENGVNPKV